METLNTHFLILKHKENEDLYKNLKSQFELFDALERNKYRDNEIPIALIHALDLEALSLGELKVILSRNTSLVDSRFFERIGVDGIGRLFQTYKIIKQKIYVSCGKTEQRVLNRLNLRINFL